MNKFPAFVGCVVVNVFPARVREMLKVCYWPARFEGSPITTVAVTSCIARLRAACVSLMYPFDVLFIPTGWLLDELSREKGEVFIYTILIIPIDVAL